MRNSLIRVHRALHAAPVSSWYRGPFGGAGSPEVGGAALERVRRVATHGINRPFSVTSDDSRMSAAARAKEMR